MSEKLTSEQIDSLSFKELKDMFLLLQSNFDRLNDNYENLIEQIRIATSTTTYDISSEGIEYGSTLNNNIGPGYVQYCNLRGRSMSQITNSNADYSFFTNMIDNGHIGIFATAITRLSGTPSKHALCVQGYSILISHSNGSVYRTLIVSDGWEYQARHILFDSSSLLWRTGIEFY